MSSFVLSCCSTADLDKEFFDKREVSYICFHYMLDGVEYPDDLGQTISFSNFYKRMEQGAETRTSQVNSEEYIEYFTKILEKGKDILHICLSSGLSGTYKSAMMAAGYLLEKYPDRKIYVVDSLGASSGYGLIMETLADKRDEGATIEELRDWIEENKLRMNHWFFSTDLKYYVKGGRISKTAGFFGGIMDICPLLNMDGEGHLKPIAKIRTKKKVIKEIVNRMIENAEGGINYNGKCFISQSAFEEDAAEVSRLVEEKFKDLNGKVVINHIGTTIGSHTGPGTIALFFWGTEKRD